MKIHHKFLFQIIIRSYSAEEYFILTKTAPITYFNLNSNLLRGNLFKLIVYCIVKSFALHFARHSYHKYILIIIFFFQSIFSLIYLPNQGILTKKTLKKYSLCLIEFQILQQSQTRLKQFIFMEGKQRKSNKPKTYAKISLDKRMKLVELITSESLSISKASKVVSIKLSTAKLILRKYRQEGAFFEKRSERLARLTTRKESPRTIEPTPSHEEQNYNQNSPRESVAYEPLPSLNQHYASGDTVLLRPLHMNCMALDMNGVPYTYWSGIQGLGGAQMNYLYFY